MEMLTAFTYEIDDPALAVSELLAQLDLGNTLKKNSIGVITCYTDFVDSGVIAGISESLPFDVIGCTSLATGTDGAYGDLLLCLTVLTGDDVSFSAAYTAPLENDLKAPIEEAYKKALSSLGDPPVMMLAFPPLLKRVGGAAILKTLDETSDGLPVFGTIACDYSAGLVESYTIFNDQFSRNSLPMVLIGGNVEPRYLISSISDEKLQKQKAIITASDGNYVQEVNNLPFIEYARTLGLTADDGSIEGMSAIPFLVDFGDGTPPLARAIYQVTPEGYASFGGDMPVGATLAIGSLDYNDVIESALTTTKSALETGKENGMLLFPCLSRNLALGGDVTAELKKIHDTLGGRVPHMAAYSGGEICPVYGPDGTPVNRFHNFTFIACVF